MAILTLMSPIHQSFWNGKTAAEVGSPEIRELIDRYGATLSSSNTI